jgi:hypothetical protein
MIFSYHDLLALPLMMMKFGRRYKAKAFSREQFSREQKSVADGMITLSDIWSMYRGGEALQVLCTKVL